MRTKLQILFSLFFLGIAAATLVASLDRSVMDAMRALGPDPWFMATLCDTYFSFITIYLWIAYKETGWFARILWFFLVMILGTFAIASYVLIQLAKLKKDEPVHHILLREKPVS